MNKIPIPVDVSVLSFWPSASRCRIWSSKSLADGPFLSIVFDLTGLPEIPPMAPWGDEAIENPKEDAIWRLDQSKFLLSKF